MIKAPTYPATSREANEALNCYLLLSFVFLCDDLAPPASALFSYGFYIRAGKPTTAAYC